MNGREALEKIAKAYVDAPGWAQPTPTSELVSKMYTIARDALAALPQPLEDSVVTRPHRGDPA